MFNCSSSHDRRDGDHETGLHYNTFRYYDSDIDQFITHDPTSISGGLNLYKYAANPISWIDPFGWACIPNKVSGTARETRVQLKLEAKFGKSNVLRERMLRDATGKKAIGPDGTGRRIDFIVLNKDGKPIYSIEVTSKTANKTMLAAKEAIIRRNGGVYVRGPKSGVLHDVTNIPTRLIRTD